MFKTRETLRKGFQVGIVAALVTLLTCSSILAAEPCKGKCQEPSAANSSEVKKDSDRSSRVKAKNSDRTKPATQKAGEDPDVDEVPPDTLVCSPTWIGGIVAAYLGVFGCR